MPPMFRITPLSTVYCFDGAVFRPAIVKVVEIGALFTPRIQSMFPCGLFMKLRKWLNLTTFGTLLFRHLTTSIVVKSLVGGVFSAPLANDYTKFTGGYQICVK